MRVGPLLWAMVRRHPGVFGADLMLQLARSCVLLIPGLVVAEVLNRMSGGAPVSPGLWALLAVLVGAAVLRVAALLSCMALDGLGEVRGATDITMAALRRLLSRPGAEPLSIARGDVVNRLTTDTSAVSGVLITSLVVVGSGAQALIAIGVLISVDPLITAVVCVPLAGAGVLIALTGEQVRRFHRESRAAGGDVSAFLGDTFNAAQVIKLSGAEAAVTQRFQVLNDSRHGKSLKSKLFTDLFLSSIWLNTSNLGTGLLLVLAVGRIGPNGLSVGDLALFVVYVGWVTDFTALFSQNLTRLKQAAVSADRIDEVLPGTVTDVVGGPAPTAFDPAPERDTLRELAVADVTYLHPGTEAGTRSVSFSVSRGELIVITGRVGSGKTTLLRAVLGLLPAQSGVVTWNGEPVSRLRWPAAAYVAQVPAVLSGTVRENITLGLDADDAALRRAVHTAVLEPDLEQLDGAMDALVGSKGARLSGGQLQRIAAARAFVREPELLVFDDLSSALDVVTERQLWERLRQQNATCLAVTHRRSVLTRADRVILLRDGAVEAIGPLEELLRTSEEMRYLWDHPVEPDADVPS